MWSYAQNWCNDDDDDGMRNDVPFLEVFSALPRCANGMKGGGPPATSERAASRLCAASD